MRLGLYIIASIILMTIVGVFVYTINPDNYNYDMFGIAINIPVAAWMVLPMFLLMMASLLHMMFYGTKNFFKFKKWEKDTNTLNDALYWSLLHEPQAHKFNIPLLKQSASLLNVASVKVNGTVDVVSEKLREALSLISEIDRGEYVDFKVKKIGKVLSMNNPLALKNSMNRLVKDASFAEVVLQNKEEYHPTVFQEALKHFVNTTTFVKAKKYIKLFDRETFLTLINRVTRENDLGLTKDILDEFIVALETELKCSDFLVISIVTMKQLSPDENLMLWREYEHKYPKAEITYLYLLFEYEMIDKAGTYLEEHDEADFKRFRALYDLKKEHKKYKITDLINIRHICND